MTENLQRKSMKMDRGAYRAKLSVYLEVFCSKILVMCQCCEMSDLSNMPAVCSVDIWCSLALPLSAPEFL